MRVFGVSYPVFDTYDHHRAVALRPGKGGWYYGEGGAYIKINRHGYRDIEHATAKSPRVFRLAVLGDSFTEARQVDIAQTFWKQLEKRLQARPEFSALQVEVLNFGVGGYGTAQEFLTLKLHVLHFSPDIVMLAFCPGNDLSDNSRQLSTSVNRTFKPFYVFHDDGLVLDNSFRDTSLRHVWRRFLLTAIHYSRVLELLNQARRAVVIYGLQHQPRRSNEIGLFDEEFLEPKNDVWRDAWSVTEAIISEMSKEVHRAGAQFVLVVLTTPIQVDPDLTKRRNFQQALGVSDLFYTERRLRSIGDRFGFPVITLAERFQETAERDHIYFHGFSNSGLGTGHWNANGHELAAAILAQELPRILRRHPRAGLQGGLRAH